VLCSLKLWLLFFQKSLSYEIVCHATCYLLFATFELILFRTVLVMKSLTSRPSRRLRGGDTRGTTPPLPWPLPPSLNGCCRHPDAGGGGQRWRHTTNTLAFSSCFLLHPPLWSPSPLHTTTTVRSFFLTVGRPPLPLGACSSLPIADLWWFDVDVHYQSPLNLVLSSELASPLVTVKVHLGPNCFGDSDKHNLWYLMLDQDVCRS
jgi:hypothetical protein